MNCTSNKNPVGAIGVVDTLIARLATQTVISAQK
jgi:hypothetical protein